MHWKKHHTLLFIAGIPLLLVAVAVLVFFSRQKHTLNSTVIADRVEAYEFTPQRDAIYVVQDGELQRYTFDTGEWEDVLSLQNTDQDIPRTLYTGEDGLVVVSDATEEKSTLVRMTSNTEYIPLVTQETVRRRPLDVSERAFCNTHIGSPNAFEQLGDYAIVYEREGDTAKAFAPHACEEQLKPYVTDNVTALTKNAFFEFDGTFIDTDTTIADSRDNIEITSRADATGFGDCSGFIGAVCPTAHVLHWRGKTFTLKEQVPHVGKRLPHSRYMSNADGQPVIPLSDGQLLLLAE